MSAAIIEAMRMVIFELFCSSKSSKANNVMNMDMVNPMPPKNPIPIIDFQFKSCGSLQIPHVTAKKLNRTIPRGLPIINPKEMPKLNF